MVLPACRSVARLAFISVEHHVSLEMFSSRRRCAPVTFSHQSAHPQSGCGLRCWRYCAARMLRPWQAQRCRLLRMLLAGGVADADEMTAAAAAAAVSISGKSTKPVCLRVQRSIDNDSTQFAHWALMTSVMFLSSQSRNRWMQ